MAIKVKNLKAGTEYKYRPYYTSMAGNTYYGEWTAFDTQDAYITYEPVLYTYSPLQITQSSATLRGYALEGSDDFTEQGFEYWIQGRANRQETPADPRTIATDNSNEHSFVTVSGISLRTTLQDLDEGTIYNYRTYAQIGTKMVYGSTLSFTTEGEWEEPQPTYIEDLFDTDDNTPKVEKILLDGTIYIRCGDKLYNLQGMLVR